MKFKNREEAGILLGQLLNSILREEEKQNAVILAIPRGGVPVAYFVAKETKIPFNIVIVKKVAHPSNPEAAVGAVSLDGKPILSEYALTMFSPEQISYMVNLALEEAQKRAIKYGFSDLDLTGKTVIIIDDGVATGYTAMAAANYAKEKGASKVILAVPVCPIDAIPRLKQIFDEVICVYKANTPFFAVGAFYDDFHQVGDEEFFYYIEKAKQEGLFYQS